MIIFTLAINLVSALGVFSAIPTGIASGTAGELFTAVSGFTNGFEYIWVILLTATGFLSFFMAKLMGSASIIGIYLFSAVFWSSFSRCIAFININGFIPADFLTIITVGLLFIWVAAVIGMLTIVS
jgi:hypothetical protein